MTEPRRFDDPDTLAAHLIERLCGRIRLGLPLGLGKPALLANALYRAARARPEIELDICTALTLEIPRARSPLEARLLDPLVERLYAGVPELDYARDQRRGTLPDNVSVHEFYLRPGDYLRVTTAQRRYVSSNYSHAARDLAQRGINVVAQMLAPAPGADAGRLYSFACNPDLTRELVAECRRVLGTPPLVIGETNPRLPYLYGSAELDAGELDAVLEGPQIGYELFPVPNRPVSLADHAIGVRVAALVRDGGTLQVGIGSLGDAVAHALALRRTDNARFRALARALELDETASELDDLPQGLYAASEMFAEGFLRLRDASVLRRTVDGGVWLHGAFFLGSAAFYERLRQLPSDERRGIDMTAVAFTNRLAGNDETVRQRRDARFVNNVMMMTLLGAAVSDALEDGAVVSGVGGQHDFVTMAHALEGGRSILMLPATRQSGGRVTSNIVWRYGHTTIPRHLRDLVVTEYGVADLRGGSDQDVIVAMLNLADSRFQEHLRRQAVDAGKLSSRYRIPARFRDNLPERLAARLARPELLGALPWYPLGSDFTAAEAELTVALGALKASGGQLPSLLRGLRNGWRAARDARLRPALERLGLARPRRLRERAYRWVVADALEREVLRAPRPLWPEPAAGADEPAKQNGLTASN